MERCAGIQLSNKHGIHACNASWLDVCSARTNIVLHTDWLIVALSILNGAAIRNLNFAFSSSAFRTDFEPPLHLLGACALGAGYG